MKLFYGSKRKIEDKIIDKANDFVSLIRKDKKLKKFVKVFGITGPAGRGQASYGKSDVDFYCITNCLNLFKEKYLRKKFDDFFKDIDYDISILCLAPSVLNKKDLMFFEFATSGKILYGKLNTIVKIDDIPKWEGIRLLTYKGDPFLAHIGTEKEEYYFSKLVLGIGESFLLLDNKYVADDFKRKELVLKNKYAKRIIGFIEIYKNSFEYRYNDKKIICKNVKEEGLRLWKEAWKIYLENYFGCSYEQALKKLRKIKPESFLKIIGTRVLYTFNYWKFFKKIRFCFKEPFIDEILMIQRYLNKSNEWLRRKIVESWWASPRFRYYK